MRVLYLATTICVLSVSILASEFSSELKNESLAKTEIQTVKIREQFMIEQYLGNNEGLESLIAYYYDYYLSEKLFFAMGTSWAVGGEHGGYGTALIGLGYQYAISEKSFLDLKVYSGAGGHIDIKAGGGVLFAWQLGLSHYITETLVLDARYGGLDYTAGDYTVNTLSLGLSYFYERL